MIATCTAIGATPTAIAKTPGMDEVLAAQGRQVELSADGCEVIDGVWRGPFTGDMFTNPGELHIDHTESAHD